MSEIDNANFIEKDKCYLVYDDFGDFRGVVLTADVVEVVRCKDCKWQDKGENECESWNMCRHNVIEHFAIYDEHFCKWGERREDGEIH